MGARISVKELIETFQETYGAIDIRTGAIREGEAWVNAFAVVRLTYEEPEVAEERLRRLAQKHGKVEGTHLWIVMCARPFSEWQKLCEEIGKGFLRVSGVDIKLRQALSLDDQRNQLEAWAGDIRPFDDTSWPRLRLQIGRQEETKLIDEFLTREVNTLGYPDAYEAINALCEVNVRLGQSLGFDFCLSLPVFVWVADARFAPLEKRLHVTVRRHNKLGNIRGIVIHRGQQTAAGQPHKARPIIESFSSSSEVGSSIETASGSVELGEIELQDWVDVRLTHPELGELDGHFSRQVRSLIAAAERNVLFEALKSFCPEPAFRESLIRGYRQTPKRLKPSAAFELRVAWLLGLFGCSTILLGEYEHFVAPETKVELGSVDILALTPGGTLLLVGCSLTAPEEKDFNKLCNVRGILKQTAFKDTTSRILPVIFSAATECSSYKEVGFLDFIPIVNAEGMDTLLALLRVGQEKDFFEFLGSPNHSPLRNPSEFRRP